jgi:hypothetical protein
MVREARKLKAFSISSVTCFDWLGSSFSSTASRGPNLVSGLPSPSESTSSGLPSPSASQR